MIAADTSSLSAFLKGETGKDVDRLTSALSLGALALPPVVLTEILSDPAIGKIAADSLTAVQRLEVLPGYWERAALSRRKLRSQRLTSKVADALIAQSCIDHNVPLITRDSDFRHFAKYCGLKLA